MSITPEVLRQDILLELRTATKRRKSPWKTPVISTMGLDNTPKARVVVLRRASHDVLELHTDIRSEKWAELTKHQHIAWTFWDRSRQVQLRVSGCVELHQNDAIAQDNWNRLGEGSRKTYRVEPAPATPIARPDSYSYCGDGYRYFGVVRCHCDWMDWLHLTRDGHKRAIFTRDADGWTGSYVSP